MSDADDIRRLIRPQCHEFTAHYNWNTDGLKPWFATDRAVKDADGSRETEIETHGERWDVTLYYQDSAVIPPESGVTPAGTEIQHETIREFRIKMEAHDDVGERKANFHIRPRWQDMTAETNDGDETEISVPEELANHRTDAVNVRVTGSNIPFGDYPELLPAAAEAVGVASRYFDPDRRHRTSNVQDAARYVRLHKDISGPIHSRTGPIVGLAHVLENDREGYRKLVQNDTDDYGNRLPGYYHTATLGPDRVQEVMPNHRLPVEAKHYYEREAFDRPKTDPLAHPKLEVSYQTSRWNDVLRATDDDIATLERELDEWLYSILNDAGLDLRAGGNTYVADEYFADENHTTHANVVSLDLTEVRHEQESVVYRHLADGMSPVEQDTLATLVTDGGELSPQDIAEKNDRHRDSVYDALHRMHDLVQHEYGSVSLKSTYVSELVADALQQAETALERATMASAKAVHAAERGLDERTSAFLAWAEKHGVNYDEPNDDVMTIELGEVDSVKQARRLLRQGYDLWQKMNREAVAFRQATVKYQLVKERQKLRSLGGGTETDLKDVYADAWKLLR
jgi:hypothetical protein